MTKQKNWLVCLVICVVFISGCAPLVVGGALVGGGTGTYYYVKGDMMTDYYYSFDKVWAACEKTIADMRGLDVEPKREIGTGTIATMIDDERVLFTIKYKAKNVSTVSIRVGLIGNKLSSQLLHDKIGDNIKK